MQGKNNQSGWEQYYRSTIHSQPREFLGSTARRFDSAAFAIDLGCGAGSETLFLLEQGWRVLAIDQEAAAIETLVSRIAPEMEELLETRVGLFDSVELPTADLIWAGRSLPFCRPQQFRALWGKICGALAPGGRFAGDLFGRRHAWSDQEDMSFYSKEEVVALCKGLHLEYMLEGEGEQRTATKGIQQWHMFTICARKL